MLNFNLNYAQKYSKYFRAYYDHQEEVSEQKHVKIRTKKKRKQQNEMRSRRFRTAFWMFMYRHRNYTFSTAAMCW